MKLVEPENLHITMRFLGEITQTMVEQVTQALLTLDFQSFQASVEGIGVFPKPTRPRVIWAGITKGREDLLSIYERLERNLRRLGFRSESGKYIPHVTLFRVRSPKSMGALVDILSQLQEKKFGELQVRAVQLKRSVLTPKGPIYSTLGETRR